jgi:hypothetical protein
MTTRRRRSSRSSGVVASYVAKLPNVPDDGTDASRAMTMASNALKAVNPTEGS